MPLQSRKQGAPNTSRKNSEISAKSEKGNEANRQNKDWKGNETERKAENKDESNAQLASHLTD